VLIKQINFCLFQAMTSLGLLAKTTGKTVTEIMEPHKDVLVDMIPPKKHLLRHQPLNAQIGLMVSCDMYGVVWNSSTEKKKKTPQFPQIYICMRYQLFLQR
jgi:hypothetical protein